MHKYTQFVQKKVSFLTKNLRNSKKMCYFAPRNFQDSKYIINILKKENYVRN